MGTRRAAKINAEVQEEQKCIETETKPLFDLLSKKLDTMNAHQERRHGEVCARIEALERSTSKLTSDIGSLKESCNKLEDELAGVKSTVEDKADMSRCWSLKGESSTYKTGRAETTWSFGMFQRAAKMVCV